MSQIRINHQRLLQNLNNFSKIGQADEGGINRALGSEADRDAREYLKDYWRKNLGIEARLDAIANLWIDYEGTEDLPRIVIGSHHDAVPAGGMFDGALGVLLATEIVETLRENDIKLKHPVSIISFTGEEPNPFNVSTLGSKVVSGRLKEKDLKGYYSRINGETLEKAIEKLGGNIHEVEHALLDDNKVAAFLECHIEQGKRLEMQQLSVAAVNCITGIHREMYTVLGEANHAGTTVMSDRRDAMLAAAELSLAMEQIAKSFHDSDVVATVGYFNVEPNEANIISGKTQCIVDIRTYKENIETEFVQKIKEAITKIELERNVKIIRDVILQQKHMPMDELVIRAVEEGIKAIGEKSIQLVSMAGHDAANMATLTKSGMIFVQSVGGFSHCKEEYTRPEDIEKVGNAMLQAVYRMDEELDAND